MYGGASGSVEPHPVLEARELTKRYSALTAVTNVSFQIAAGQVLGVLGPNGSGKSTIVKMVTGLVAPSSGSILFQGRGAFQDADRFKATLGYVPEQADLYGFLTGWEYLEFVATLRRMNRRTFAHRASAMLRAFMLYPSRDLPIATYSKGMRQRIAIIAALLHNPGLLVLDEPFSGLDVTSSLVLQRVIALSAEQGKAILFSSPVLEQMSKLCTHLVVLKRGSVAAAGSMSDIDAGFGRLGFEAGFLRLTEQVDSDEAAQTIVAAARTA
jgi:ABC-2 type transport system ATP-binding protein